MLKYMDETGLKPWIATGNQTWQWKIIEHLPFIDDFPINAPYF